MIVACAACGGKNRIPSERLNQRPHCGRCKAPIVLATPIALPDAQAFDELIAGSPYPVVVDFWAAWCGPCRMVAPEIERLAKKLAGKVVVAKLDTEAVPEVAGRFGIQSIPAFVVYRGGREAGRTVGAMSASELAQRLALPT